MGDLIHRNFWSIKSLETLSDFWTSGGILTDIDIERHCLMLDSRLSNDGLVLPDRKQEGTVDE